MKKETIIARIYELLKFACTVVEKIPRKYKFTLGDRIIDLLSDILELLIEAFYTPNKHKAKLLAKINLQLEKFRYYNRLAFELNLYNMATFKHLLSETDEIGRMVGGWLKSLQK